MINGRYFAGIDTLPTHLMWIDNISYDLLDGKNTIFMLKRDVKQLICKKVVKLCEERGERTHLVDVREINKETPRQYFTRLAGLTNSSHVSTIQASAIMASSDCPGVIIIDGLEDLGEDGRKLWVPFLGEWIRHCRNYPRNGDAGKAMLILLKDTHLLKQLGNDGGWGVIWYWGWMTHTEVELALRGLLLQSRLSAEESSWLSAFLSHLSGPDLDLLQYLFDCGRNLADESSILESLKDFAVSRGMLDSGNIDLYQKYKNLAPGGNNVVPEKLHILWERGIVENTIESGLFFNSAFLAGAGENAVIRHRMWQGLNSYLMPRVDQSRLKLCSYLNSMYSWEWQEHCKKDIKHDETQYREADDDAGDAVLETNREIKCVVNFMSQKQPFTDSKHKKLFAAAKVLKKARNTLAHGKVMDKDRFKEVINSCSLIEGLIKGGA